jgi:uncharacterized membrane protein YphA (DoxX/SURF4 family)
MLASMFIAGGIDAVQHPDSKVKRAEPVAMPLAERLPLPDDPAELVRINGAVQAGAGVLLAAGKLPRLAALALIGSLIPTTAAGHRFWEETDDQARAQQRTHFLKNMAMLGGLILAATDTDGRPSLSWRARQAKDEARQRTLTAKDDTTDLARHLKDEARQRTLTAKEDAVDLARHVKHDAKQAARHAGSEARKKARHARAEAAARARQLKPG